MKLDRLDHKSILTCRILDKIEVDLKRVIELENSVKFQINETTEHQRIVLNGWTNK